MTLYDFLSGAVTVSFCVVGLFFLRFWRRTTDPLFLTFALAFWLLAIAQGVLALSGLPVEERSWVYLIRLAGFILLIAGIYRKNRSTSRP